jgi:hypothetical protein
VAGGDGGVEAGGEGGQEEAEAALEDDEAHISSKSKFRLNVASAVDAWMLSS